MAIPHITEPMTMVTDYVLVALAAAFAARIRLRAGDFSTGSVRWWCLAFATTALAALFGGTAHGFRLYLGEELHANLWRMTVGMIALSVAVTLGAAIRSVLRPSIDPGDYFRVLFAGFFEGLDSERQIAWRLSDSLSLRRFVGLALNESSPHPSSLSRTRRLSDLETHRAVFTWVLQV
jgi:hypothetical protein